jgi:PTH1 family peptidyl-tRNA hydrolase
MFRFLESFFKVKGTWLDEKDTMKKFLVVGLGNIGEEYMETRHNIGFKILDSLSAEENFTFETAKLGDVGVFKVKGRSILCLKPSTYMNRSGKAVKYWMDKENIPIDNVLIITDDINLSFGTIRLKTKGSDGGHNGLKDVQQYLLTTNYNRLRFGVGSDFGKGKQIDYVLGEWNQEERDVLIERYKRVNALIRSFVLSGVNRTMNEYNGT